MAEHFYELTGEWQNGINGLGSVSTKNLDQKISVPAEFGGQGIGTNPEELILAASASCFLITLAAILQFQNIKFFKIEVKSKASFGVSNAGPSLKMITHSPTIIIKNADNIPENHNKIRDCFVMAEQSCMLTKAFKGNVEITSNGELSFIN